MEINWLIRLLIKYSIKFLLKQMTQDCGFPKVSLTHGRINKDIHNWTLYIILWEIIKQMHDYEENVLIVGRLADVGLKPASPYKTKDCFPLWAEGNPWMAGKITGDHVPQHTTFSKLAGLL